MYLAGIKGEGVRTGERSMQKRSRRTASRRNHKGRLIVLTKGRRQQKKLIKCRLVKNLYGQSLSEIIYIDPHARDVPYTWDMPTTTRTCIICLVACSVRVGYSQHAWNIPEIIPVALKSRMYLYTYLYIHTMTSCVQCSVLSSYCIDTVTVLVTNKCRQADIPTHVDFAQPRAVTTQGVSIDSHHASLIGLFAPYYKVLLRPILAYRRRRRICCHAD
eukprot:6207025-Pleurochrysis_carterae.AAC.1